MAEVLTLDKKKKNTSTQKKVDGFMTRNRTPILIVAAVVVAAAIGVCVYVGITDSQRKSGLADYDKIEYTYTNNFESLSEEKIVTRQNDALESLKALTGKKGVVGVRANMLAAEISFAKKDYVNSKDYWIAAAEADKKAYTSAYCYYNAGVCYEETGDNQTAAEYYQKALDDKQFLLDSRALMGLGRIKEASGDYKGASEIYQKIVDEFSSDSWKDLAQTRLIQLQVEGKTN